MDPCVPGVSTADARSFARVKLGVPPKYAKKMTAKQICAAAKACKSTNIMPPMEYRVYKGKVYLIDPETPLSIEDYIAIFKKGDLTRIKKIAGNLGLVPASLSKKELITNIVQVLVSFNLAEPIELPSKRSKAYNSGNAGVGAGNMGMAPVGEEGPGEEGTGPGSGEEGMGPVGEEPGPTGNAGQFKQMYTGNSGQQPNSTKLYNTVNTSVGSFITPNPGKITNNSKSNSNFKSKSSWKWPWQSRNNSLSETSSSNVSDQLRRIQNESKRASVMLQGLSRNVEGNNRTNTVKNAVMTSVYK
jgi:hypothetical protein